MKTSESRSLLGVVLLAFFLEPAGLRAADTNGVIEAWLAAQTNFSTWTAEFVQTRWLKALNQPLVSTGQVWFARPNRFRWELGVPAQTIAVRDDQLLQVIYPRLKRVEHYPLDAAQVSPMSEALGLLDAGFPRNRADFDARFRVRSLESVDQAWQIELEPSSASARRVMPTLRVVLAATDFSLLATEMQFPDGSRMRSDYRSAAFNRSFSKDLFRPAIAPDFLISKPLAP